MYYADLDADGYGSKDAVLLCESTAPAGYSSNNTDCDDSNATVQEGQFYVDADADGYGAYDLITACYGASTPSGYSLDNTDCDDMDALVWRSLYILCRCRFRWI